MACEWGEPIAWGGEFVGTEQGLNPPQLANSASRDGICVAVPAYNEPPCILNPTAAVNIHRRITTFPLHFPFLQQSHLRKIVSHFVWQAASEW
ncbi:MAG: hypothetical protein WCB11_18630 [Terriglobales bacterium]